MSNYKVSVRVIATLVVLLCAGLFVVNNELTRAPYVSFASASGDFQVEAVRTSWLLGASGMVYLRFVDKKNPNQVYRTPLTSETSLDMQSFEDKDIVGIAWIDLNKDRRTFTLSVPNWKAHWANFIISNTPYEIMDN
ncbi:hypothetical protein [Pseudomonas sp. EL_65y_Pfl2_R96]|uniref:hypothetical protein n=1 Tax=Pseudomonas sp. EL_65y_Pfl2_R96 TaxID=3088699 RepID=UPI0030D9C905